MQDKRLIAEWVGGRKLDSELVGAAEKMPNRCASSPQVRQSGAPAWNGWGVDYRNSRFQPGAAAGLTPGQVSRLQLKWAFGFPGATALYGQTVHDGRLYVTSNAGYVYSLDAETGCVHWGFRADSGPERVHDRPDHPKDPRLAIFFGEFRQRVRALREHRRTDLENAHRSASARAHYRDTGALRRTPVRAGRLARGTGIGTGRLRLLQVPRLHVGPRGGHGQPDLEDVYDSGNPEGRREELAGKGHARTGRRRHLGDTDARRQTAGGVRHNGQRLRRDTEDSQRDDGDEHRHGQGALVDAGAGGGHLAQRVCPEHSRGGVSRSRWRRGAWRPRRGPAIPYPPENCPAVLGPDWDFAAPAASRQPPTGATSSSRRRNRGSSGR